MAEFSHSNTAAFIFVWISGRTSCQLFGAPPVWNHDCPSAPPKQTWWNTWIHRSHFYSRHTQVIQLIQYKWHLKKCSVLNSTISYGTRWPVKETATFTMASSWETIKITNHFLLRLYTPHSQHRVVNQSAAQISAFRPYIMRTGEVDIRCVLLESRYHRNHGSRKRKLWSSNQDFCGHWANRLGAWSGTLACVCFLCSHTIGC